jgi:hypothetical protein
MKLCSKLQVTYEYMMSDHRAYCLGQPEGVHPAVYADLKSIMGRLDPVWVSETETYHWKLNEKTLARKSRQALSQLYSYYGLYKAELILFSSETLSITMYFANESINVTELLTAFEDQNAHKLSFDPVRTWIS